MASAGTTHKEFKTRSSSAHSVEHGDIDVVLCWRLKTMNATTEVDEPQSYATTLTQVTESFFVTCNQEDIVVDESAFRMTQTVQQKWNFMTLKSSMRA